ncbi:hypothetical protein BDA96_05G109400 [Sorghum bicolor]|uniref:Uncharacterized protein n=1 Tax=Sorghum bicolor TaxID=4558 RepID=A0A921QXL2_SORBI|nr:hypothetical protein BDA96_05G109400 [Sorghum bicolor]
MLVFLFLGARLSSVTNLMKQQKLKKSPLVEIGPVVGSVAGLKCGSVGVSYLIFNNASFGDIIT